MKRLLILEFKLLLMAISLEVQGFFNDIDSMKRLKFHALKVLYHLCVIMIWIRLFIHTA